MNWLIENPIAHRGLHDGTVIPENSLKAFELAVEHNFPIELDVHQLTDGNLIVFHDDNLERLTGLRKVTWDQNLTEIKRLRLFNTDQKIPTLDEVLALVNGKVPLLIEIKNKRKIGNLEQTLWKKISSYKGEYAVQSFNPFSIGWFKKNAPEVIRGQLSSDFKGENLAIYKKFIMRRLLMNCSSSPAFIAYDIKALPYWIVSLIRAKGKPVIAWTIKTKEDQHKATKYADNIIFEGIRPQG